MVTGDNKATAEAVARQVGAMGSSSSSSSSSSKLGGLSLAGGGDGLSLTGAEFDALSALQQQDAAAGLAVFSRWAGLVWLV